MTSPKAISQGTHSLESRVLGNSLPASNNERARVGGKGNRCERENRSPPRVRGPAYRVMRYAARKNTLLDCISQTPGAQLIGRGSREGASALSFVRGVRRAQAGDIMPLRWKGLAPARVIGRGKEREGGRWGQHAAPCPPRSRLTARAMEHICQVANPGGHFFYSLLRALRLWVPARASQRHALGHQRH